eukprot:CFRG0629T1
MGFQKTIDEQCSPQWAPYAIDYAKLKFYLKRYTKKDKWDGHNEALFMSMVEDEMKKNFDFQGVKRDELERKVQHLKNKAFKANTEDHAVLRGQIDELTLELTQLAKFNSISYTALLKIVKKHDKYTPFRMRETFLTLMEGKEANFETFDDFVVALGILYAQVTPREEYRAEPETEPEGWIDWSAKVAINAASRTKLIQPAIPMRLPDSTTTTTYWVHPDNVTEVKCLILKHLPVYTYPALSNVTRSNLQNKTNVHSIYLDTDDFQLYQNKIKNLDGDGDVLRMRWYSDTDKFVRIQKSDEKPNTPLRDDESVVNSVKLKEKYANKFLSGELKMKDRRAKFLSRGVEEEEVDGIIKAVENIQSSILTEHYKPQFRVSYNRMLFVDSHVHSVDMCLDSEIVYVLESGFQHGNWRRTDEDCKYPYSSLNTKQYAKFPYAMLQVNTHHYGDRPAPPWVDEIINSSLCIPIKNFSKYLQGVSSLFSDRVDTLPYWHTKLLSHGGLLTPTSAGGGGSVNSGDQDLEKVYDAERRASQDFHDISQPNYTVVPMDGESDPSEVQRRNQSVTSEGDVRGDETKLKREKSVRDRKQKNVMMLSRMMKSLARKIPNMSISTATQAKKNENKKPIAIPVRVEPKVLFANERTMLRWINITMWLSTIGIGLIHQTGHKAWVSRSCGYLLVPVSIMFIMYAVYMFLWRDWKVRSRDPGPYNSFAGPVVITSKYEYN